MSDCPLNPDQLEIIKWLADGKLHEEVADLVGVSRTIVWRRTCTAKNLAGAATTASLVAMSLRKGWIE